MAPSDVENWIVSPDKVDAVVRRLVESAAPQRIYLFGSFVRGDINAESDLDVLVVTEDSVTNPRRESVRLRQLLRGIHMPMDILVVTASEFAEHRRTPGLIYREVAESGRLVYERPR